MMLEGRPVVEPALGKNATYQTVQIAVLLHKFKKFTPESKSHIFDLIEGRLYLPLLAALNDPHEDNGGNSNIRVCSFASGSNSNYMMWVHYAGSFNGVAVEYDYGLVLRACRGIENCEITRVRYVVSKPAPLKEKYFQWFYEQEYRVVSNDPMDDAQAYLNVKPLKVAIGEFVEADERKAIEYQCKRFGIHTSPFHRNIAIHQQPQVFDEYKEALHSIGTNVFLRTPPKN